jgi:squalene-hopene/tetraprenyl-beta-curcumene cyclase
MLCQHGETAKTSLGVSRALDFLRSTHEKDGSWYGRWGVNNIYGTCSVLCDPNAVGVDLGAPEVGRAVAWLISIQNADGGWGEDCASCKLGLHRL